MPGGISNASLATGAAPLAGKTILYNYAYAINDLTVAVRTVTAGKTYYMLGYWLSIKATADNEAGYIFVENDPAGTIILMNSSITATYKVSDTQTAMLAFPYPIPIVAGQTIRVASTAATITAFAGIVGWEE